MIWKILTVAEKRFKSLKGYALLPDVYAGKHFADGVMVSEKESQKGRLPELLFTHLLTRSLELGNATLLICRAY